jgi:hypothetical protein
MRQTVHISALQQICKHNVHYARHTIFQCPRIDVSIHASFCSCITACVIHIVEHCRIHAESSRTILSTARNALHDNCDRCKRFMFVRTQSSWRLVVILQANLAVIHMRCSMLCVHAVCTVAAQCTATTCSVNHYNGHKNLLPIQQTLTL